MCTLLAMLLHKGNDEWEFARREGRYGKPVRWEFNKSTLADRRAGGDSSVAG